MNPDVFWTYVIPSILGLIAGATGSLVAPWVRWGIEKRRQKLERRRELIDHWRALIHDVSEYKAKGDEETEYTPFRRVFRTSHPHSVSRTSTTTTSRGISVMFTSRSFELHNI